MITLVVDNLAIGRGIRRIAEGLTFRVAAGEGLLLTGPNGAGKTTLLRTIAGFLRPLDGSVRLDGLGDEREFGEACHYVGHANGLRGSLTARENLVFWQRFFSGVTDPAMIDAALDAFNLLDLEDIPAGALSAGQKRRLGLARVLAAKRPLWLLDEPNVSLDTASQRLFAAVVDRHLSSGGVALAATHLQLGSSISRELKLGQRQEVAA